MMPNRMSKILVHRCLYYSCGVLFSFLVYPAEVRELRELLVGSVPVDVLEWNMDFQRKAAFTDCACAKSFFSRYVEMKVELLFRTRLDEVGDGLGD